MRSELQHLVKNWSFDIPFERAVRIHYAALQQLETAGLTWATIAGALTRAGARHKNGRPISARQMNSVFLRVRNAQSTKYAHAASFDPAPRMRPIADETGRVSYPTPTKSSDESVAISVEAMATSAPRLMTGLAQRLNEARKLSEASRTEYDD
jgi:hypothetical protein